MRDTMPAPNHGAFWQDRSQLTACHSSVDAPSSARHLNNEFDPDC